MSEPTKDALPEVALYGTQGGGLAYFDDSGILVWHKVPGWLKAEPGDPVPVVWDYQPANETARRAG